jgi:hypothetical protein
MPNKKKKHNKSSYIVGSVIVLLVVVLGVIGAVHLFHKSTPGKAMSSSGSNSLPPKNPTTSTLQTNNGTAEDQGGKISSNDISSNPSDWTVSDSGQTTLKAPIKSSTLKPGGLIAGSAVGPTVQYRLIDSQVGVISQGSISVVGGNFSATVNFTPYAKDGRLDVFNVDSQGREINEVQIPVKF